MRRKEGRDLTCKSESVIFLKVSATKSTGAISITSLIDGRWKGVASSAPLET
jgi:hypothetical protein